LIASNPGTACAIATENAPDNTTINNNAETFFIDTSF
jgi:hypothetical protein